MYNSAKSRNMLSYNPTKLFSRSSLNVIKNLQNYYWNIYMHIDK